ncbi:DNA-J chaperone, putative [Bodo saltans]|uniref:DNA-J chaperone, putative n=1 Tax=Bodo saltans TaxID=75058 RepID=A0A0S4IP06_BODSA|nr:DNA-J chaperone, putative [Bodo saltans]|eukprot:CUE89851.1 DNA-J chaperone, putative [Bodo saltans]
MLRVSALRIARARGSGAAAAAAAGPFDPYKILGLPSTATTDEAKKAYHKLALRFHPDAPEGNKERFQAVQEAHEAIKNGWVAGQRSDTGGDESDGDTAGGARKYRSSYVYEEPGSTDDNYVSSNPTLQRNLQLLMVTCFVVFMLRMVMHLTSSKKDPAVAHSQQPAGAPDLSGFMNASTASATPSQHASSSVHEEGDAEWRRYKERNAGGGDNTGSYRFEIGGKPTS